MPRSYPPRLLERLCDDRRRGANEIATRVAAILPNLSKGERRAAARRLLRAFAVSGSMWAVPGSHSGRR